MADIVINPSVGKIDFFTTKGDQSAANSLRLTGTTVLFAGPISASSISTGGGGAFVTSVQPTTNYLSKFTGNSTIANSLVYDNGTNVGIGTTSPAAKLEVKGADDATITAIFQSTAGGNAAYNGGIQLGNAASSQNSKIYHDSSGDNTLTFVSSYGSGTGNKFIFSPGGTERVRFQQNGNVGIGTSTTTGLLTLHGTYPQLVANNPTTGSGVVIQLKDNGRDAGFIGHSTTTSRLQFGSKGIANTQMTLDANGNLGIGITNPNYLLQVNGSFAATTKSFVINHPDPAKSDKQLQHGVTEAPEHTVFVRGKLTNNNTIELPDYWPYLVDDNTITVTITPVGSYQQLYVQSIQNNKVTIANNNNMPIHCYYYVVGERKDIPKLIVEL